MKKTILRSIGTCAFVFLFSACSLIGGSQNAPENQDDITAFDPAGKIAAVVAESNTKRNEKTGSTAITAKVRLKNVSDESIMEVRCTLLLMDEAGNVLTDVSKTYNGLDAPIAPGETVLCEVGWQEVLDGKPDHIEITVDEVWTEEEASPIHLPQPKETLDQALADPHLSALEENPPIELELWIDQGGAGSVTTLTDPQEIREAIERFMNIKIQSESEEWVTDHYNRITITFSDGEKLSIPLNLKNLEISASGSRKLYALENLEPFWSYMQDRAEPLEGDEDAGS